MKKFLAIIILLIGCNKFPQKELTPITSTTAEKSVATICPVTSTAAVLPVQHLSSKIDIAFSPHGGCTEKIVKLLDSAKKSIYLQAYSFTSKPIGDAVVRANERQVSVHLILDKSDTKGHSLLNEMRYSKVDVVIDYKHPISHNKIIVVDERFVETGSFNYSKQAESNAENCLVIDDVDVAKNYLNNWKEHRKHSE